jgi:hypothetical protein
MVMKEKRKTGERKKEELIGMSRSGYFNFKFMECSLVG